MTHLISNFLSNHLKNIECVFQRSWIIKAKEKAHRKFFRYAEVFENSIFCDTMFASLSCSYFGTHLSHMQMEIIFLHYLMGILIINSLHVMQNFCNTWLPKKVRGKAGSIFFSHHISQWLHVNSVLVWLLPTAVIWENKFQTYTISTSFFFPFFSLCIGFLGNLVELITHYIH